MSPRNIEARVFLRENFTLGEGPFWFEDRLWWVDITAGILHSVDGEGKNPSVLSVGRKLGAAAPAGEGRFIAALEDGIAFVHRASAEVELIARPERDRPSNRFNDAKCDPAGRFVAGTLSMVGERNVSSLYSIGKNGVWQNLLSELTLSNGLAWSADGGTMYHVDSLAYRISKYPYDVATGRIGEGTVVVEVPREAGIPDGMEIDIEGNLWVGHWGGFAIRCWSPVTGECLARVSVPCAQPTSCCFGGPGLNRLFITTAREGMKPEALAEQPLAGSIFVCDPGTTGVPVRSFTP